MAERRCRRCDGPVGKWVRVCTACKTLTCEWCGEDFEVDRPYKIDEQRFCSQQCQLDHQRGKAPDVEVPDGQKWCMRCEQVKPRSEFDRMTGDRRHPRCRPCRREWRDYASERDYDRERLRLWRESGHLRMRMVSVQRRSRFREHLRRVDDAINGGGGQAEMTRTCRVCAREFTTEHESQIYCSTKCSWRRQRRRRRARMREAFVEDVDLSDIYRRDGGVCQICGGRVDRRCTYPHPKMPVLDHIVPLSKGGEHSRRNVQLAHYDCNDQKKDQAVGSQLRLIG